MHLKQSICGLFVAKVDVSEIIILLLHNTLPTFEIQLPAHGYGICSINSKRNSSGTLDRKIVVEHLCKEYDFREKGDFASAIGSNAPKILNDTDSDAKYVCTWISTYNGNTMCTTLYNKIVSNFEAGEIPEQFCGHLAD